MLVLLPLLGYYLLRNRTTASAPPTTAPVRHPSRNLAEPPEERKKQRACVEGKDTYIVSLSTQVLRLCTLSSTHCCCFREKLSRFMIANTHLHMTLGTMHIPYILSTTDLVYCGTAPDLPYREDASLDTSLLPPSISHIFHHTLWI